VLTLDQKYYDTAAKMLLAGEDLHQLHGLRPLLYPMFLAVLDKAGGTHGIDLSIVVQHLLGVLTGVLVAVLGARLFRHRLCGLAGGVLYLLAPVPLYFEGELLIESSYIFLVCLALLVLLRAAEASGWKAGLLWLLGGALTILTAQARPNILIFMAVFPLFAAWRWWHFRRGASALPLLGLLGGVAMAIPWGFVNKMQSDHFQVIPSAGGVNFYFGNKRTADGMVPEQERRVTYGDRYEDSGEVWAREEYAAALRAQGRRPQTDPMTVSKYWTARALGEIKAAPLAWLGLEAKKCWLMLWNAEVPNNKAFAFLEMEYAWLRLLPVRWVVLLMLAPGGIWAAAKWGNRGALFILLVYLALYSAGNVAFFICDRYRYPLWPVMASIAGGGLMVLVDTVRQWRWTANQPAPSKAGTARRAVPVRLGNETLPKADSRPRPWRATLYLAAGMAAMALISLPNWFGARLPSFARDYLFRSIACYEKGRFTEALSDIDRSIALDDGDVTALHHRGNVLLALNRFDEARQDYERTLKINTDDAGVWNNYGVALEGLGRTNEALQAFRRGAESNPPSKSAYLGMVFEQFRRGHLDEAAATLDRLEKLEKGPNAVVLAIRSVLARQRGDAAQADALERRARALDPVAAEWAVGEMRKAKG
jgi:Tfp pilus assembly protein PilF